MKKIKFNTKPGFISWSVLLTLACLKFKLVFTVNSEFRKFGKQKMVSFVARVSMNSRILKTKIMKNI